MMARKRASFIRMKKMNTGKLRVTAERRGIILKGREFELDEYTLAKRLADKWSNEHNATILIDTPEWIEA